MVTDSNFGCRCQVEAFLTHLEAAGRASSTVSEHRRVLARLLEFLETEGGPSATERSFATLIPWNHNGKLLRYGPIDHIVIQDFLRWQQARYRGAGSPEARRNRSLQTLRLLFVYLWEIEELSVIPTRYVRSARLPHHVPHRKYLMPKECDLLLAAASAESGPTQMEYVVLKTLLLSGVRPSELCSLTPERLWLDTNQIIVHGKRGRREVTIPDQLVGLLRAYVKSSTFRRSKGSVSDALFRNMVSGKPLNPRSLGRLLRKLSKKAGLKRRVIPYSTRHTFATVAYDQGVPEAMVSRLLGHDRLPNTHRYVHLHLRQLRALASKNPAAMPLARVLKHL